MMGGREKMKKVFVSYSDLESLFMRTNITLEGLSDLTGVPCATVGRWAQKGKWSELRKWYRENIGESKKRLLAMQLQMLDQVKNVGVNKELLGGLAEVEKALVRRGMLVEQAIEHVEPGHKESTDTE
jgi:saccharopine dehydrogenase-like NADP-dependent oxidoreductase